MRERRRRKKKITRGKENREKRKEIKKIEKIVSSIKKNGCNPGKNGGCKTMVLYFNNEFNETLKEPSGAIKIVTGLIDTCNDLEKKYKKRERPQSVVVIRQIRHNLELMRSNLQNIKTIKVFA